MFSIQQIQETAFSIAVMLCYILIGLYYLGISKNFTKELLRTINFYLQIYVCIVLLWRFNPLRNTEFSNLDKRIAFSAGLIIFTTSVFNSLLSQYSALSKA